MRRSCGSFTSLVSHSSINSQTKILNSKDFKNYIANMEDDIIKLFNDYYHFADKYDKKLYHIINRYDDRTNKLFIDLRYRDAESRRLNNKIDYISKEVSKIKEGSNNTIYICDMTDIKKDIIDTGDRISNNIFIILCIYTIYVFSLVITY
uniref:Uncharacterized protein n=1 Tax=viral metagenome TaxID=1070528 RepID=A0A6C0K5P2_9ZZZZ